MRQLHLPTAWPAPADPIQAAVLAAAMDEHRAGRGCPAAEAGLIACLGGNSPYLAGLVCREADCFDRLCARGPDVVMTEILDELGQLPARQPQAAIARALRSAKRRMALACAVADIGGLWSLEQVTTSLSQLAEAALGLAVRHLLLEAARRQELTLASPEAPEDGCGFVVLGMGKLGARELNYSSDIDLVLLYDPDAQPGHDDLQRTFTRMSADLVRLMETRDADGYVFRMDLRLRPDPGSTPPAVSLPAAITYYESLGQTWERAALTKARPVAGDLARGRGFLETIRPFIWRRHLDFAAIGDIVAMKRRIDRHRGAVGRPPLGVPGMPYPPCDALAILAGHDLKLGHGGIREIEFLAQTMLLVWGGRAPELRNPTTLGALAGLAEGSYMPAGLAADLAGTYRLLRRAEHRLQMRDDRQTHSLPADPTGFDRFALFMGCPDGEALARLLLEPMRRVHAAFGDRFATGPAGREPEPFCHLDAPDLVMLLRHAGFAEPDRAAAILVRWRDRHLRALRSDRAQELLRDMLPGLLAALLEQQDPMLALVRFDSLLARQSSGVQLLSLLAHNPPLLGRIAVVLGAAPSLAEHLAVVPSALEGLLLPENARDAGLRVLRLVDRQVRASSGVEEAIARARSLVRGEEFRLSLAQLDNRIDSDAAGIARSDLADHVIAGLLAVVERAHRARHGRVRGGGMVVVALGKAGSRGMMSGSDLDLMLVYDHPEDVSDSTLPAGRKAALHSRSLPASQYYIRLAHALIAALSAPGREGPLYALDMRLRPSGSKGPVAVSRAAFRRYHAEQAWTWERMALTRARLVAGPRALRQAMTCEIRSAMAGPEVPAGVGRRRTLQDACEMRARIARDLPPRGRWDIKLLSGGLLEVEFIAQALQIAGTNPSVRHPATRIALRRLLHAGLLRPFDADRLIDADRFWRSLQGRLRILFGIEVAEPCEAWAPAVRDALLVGLDEFGIHDLDELQAFMAHVAAEVRSLFTELLGDPALPPAPPRGGAASQAGVPAGGTAHDIPPGIRTNRMTQIPTSTQGPKAGDPAPAFDLPASFDRRARSTDLAGAPYVLYF